MWMHVYISRYIEREIDTCVYTYVYVYVHTYIHICVCTFFLYTPAHTKCRDAAPVAGPATGSASPPLLLPSSPDGSFYKGLLLWCFKGDIDRAPLKGI